ncbi:hypothetical protein LIER_27356 [Lithospermum erythrorhizon]|uniref:Uncharacterized protein n=1 Tax=Lithospermum erythrorhizon TaxID=34254 RepID=A0AAV3RDA1_LITER
MYYKDGMEKTVKADENPFAIEESHFADGKYYKKRSKPQHEEGSEAPQTTSSPQTTISTLQEAEEDLVQAFKGLTLPLAQPEKVARSPLKTFVRLKEGPNIEHGSMGLKTYDHLLKAGYDPIKDKATRQLPPEVADNKAHGLNNIQKMVK